jgi:2-desacetyl-2-hydroxyethyl bacteriochlorophyllide A dehydrogenase
VTPTARAFWIVRPGQGEIRQALLPERTQDDVLVRALYSGISRGTEALVFNGRVPPTEYTRMRAPHQEGDFPAPVKYGYASVGIVTEGPAALAGRTVFALYPHQTHYVVPASSVIVVPHDVPAGRAVLAANLETAVNGLWDAAPCIGDRITIVGAGVVGCLAAWLAARIPGCQVQLIDTNSARAGVAQALGVSFARPEAATENADLVIHASGTEQGLRQALALAGFEASVVELSWHGHGEVSLPLGEAFHARRLAIRSSQVGHVAPRQRARWDSRRRLALTLALLADSSLDALISGESAFDELPETLAGLAGEVGDALCHRVRYPDT